MIRRDFLRNSLLFGLGALTVKGEEADAESIAFPTQLTGNELRISGVRMVRPKRSKPRPSDAPGLGLAVTVD